MIDAVPQDFLVEAAAEPTRAHLLPPLAELFDRAGLEPLPLNAKAARKKLGPISGHLERSAESAAPGDVVLGARGVGHRYGDAAPVLSDVSFELHAGERAVLMGANGSGKSTLLRLAHGVQRLRNGKIDRAGEVALLLQNPNDYLIHERVADEAPVEALAKFGLDGFAERDPRDLSGGERQRLALAIVMQSDPAALLLDEPTRGMDQSRKLELSALLHAIASRGTAVLVATHDTEFAACFAQRALLLGGGALLADGPAAEVLGGGWHFSTAVANLLPGSGALTPAEGAELL